MAWQQVGGSGRVGRAEKLWLREGRGSENGKVEGSRR